MGHPNDIGFTTFNYTKVPTPLNLGNIYRPLFPYTTSVTPFFKESFNLYLKKTLGRWSEDPYLWFLNFCLKTKQVCFVYTFTSVVVMNVQFSIFVTFSNIRLLTYLFFTILIYHLISRYLSLLHKYVILVTFVIQLILFSKCFLMEYIPK